MHVARKKSQKLINLQRVYLVTGCSSIIKVGFWQGYMKMILTGPMGFPNTFMTRYVRCAACAKLHGQCLTLTEGEKRNLDN